MTEFLIAASFVLVPLFVFIPLLGKYIDFKHAGIQAARYQAWEYTVWFENPNAHDLVKDYNPGVAGFVKPGKSLTETQNESLVRLMSTVGNEPAGGTGIQPANPIPRLTDTDKTATYAASMSWADHRGLPFFTTPLTMTTADPDAITPTLNLFGIPIGALLQGAFKVMDMAFSAVGSAVRFAGTPAGFTAINTDGYSKVRFDAVANGTRDVVALRTRLNNDRNLAPTPLTFTSKAAVLADGWNAGGTVHAQEQVAGMTPATLVRAFANLPGLSQILTLVGWIMPEFSLCNPPPPPIQLFDPPASPAGHLWLGYVDSDVVHPDRLSDAATPDLPLGQHICDAAGICDWEPAVKALPQPIKHAPCIP